MPTTTTRQQPVSLRDKIIAFDKALTAQELANLFSLDRDTIYKQARAGSIPNFRVGTSIRFDPKTLCEWLDKQ